MQSLIFKGAVMLVAPMAISFVVVGVVSVAVYGWGQLAAVGLPVPYYSDLQNANEAVLSWMGSVYARVLP
ncbi:hypothetical protein SAMN05216215_101880 [Saccharopolyspora shandongensis]|uniref:Uncharacterized protein n=1 Tax=Saccharopolyspora shandongensis TaxID=418495 RepID=A0A1H3G7P2_9PSEU|nr:hypothetical protein [Saccharopolyspora shandongensis]SDX99342.1 hypothetical protein SAMN05216215_101880 [Saccharopolyspora shandongensis]